MRGSTAAARVVSIVIVAALAAGGATTAWAADAWSPATSPVTTSADELEGALTIEPAEYTASPMVTLHLEAPANDDSLLRISNDGTTFVIVPFAATLEWSLIDPAAGGVDEDGLKTVTVHYGDGTDWDRWASATVTLIRTPPSGASITGVAIDGRLWRGPLTTSDPYAFTAVTDTRVSLDGGATWGPWTAGTIVDVWNATDPGEWASGDRSLQVQLRDVAGNVSEPVTTTAVISAPSFSYPPYEWNLPGVTFETPYPAITGQPFTIRVVYPEGYELPSNAWCRWRITWGDDDSVLRTADPTWGELMIERSKASGACAEWTFTVPYRGARQFAWSLYVGTKNANTPPMELVTGIIERPTGESQIFRALDGPHDERFASSSIPFAYVLPETTISQKGDPVTYRLHTVGTTTVPQSGLWWTYPLNCELNPNWSQSGGNTFTYKPFCDGPWVTGWTGVMYKGYMRSQYDPLVDGRAPKVSPPVVKLAKGGYRSYAPAVVSWSAKDSGSGVYRSVLELSRNGGSWQRLDLPSRLATSFSKPLGLSGTYRFRVKVRDAVGNWSAWAYGPTVRALAKEEWSTLTRWSGPWTRVGNAALSDGKAKAIDVPGAMRITTTARSIAWVSRVGPGRGLAQVYVDGTLAATVDLNAPALGSKAVVFTKSWSSSGTHVLRIVPLGTIGRPLVEVDAFLVVR